MPSKTGYKNPIQQDGFIEKLLNASKGSDTDNLGTLLLNSEDLTDLSNSLETNYSSTKLKNYSNDMSSYSMVFDSGTTRAIVSYKVLKRTIFQIIYLIPKQEAIEIINNYISINCNKKQVGNNDIWINPKTNLLYEVRGKDDIGMLVVKNQNIR